MLGITIQGSYALKKDFNNLKGKRFGCVSNQGKMNIIRVFSLNLSLRKLKAPLGAPLSVALCESARYN